MVSSKTCRADRIRLGRTILGAAGLALLALPTQFSTSAEAKTPGATYCYYGKCHRVMTISETQKKVGVEEMITASHYDDCKRDRYNPCGLTSSGERFHPDRPDNTASPIYPDGTMLLVWSPETQRALVVRVNNAGPYWGNRKLDLSRAAAAKLGFEGKGVAKVRVRVVKAPAPEEATYVRNREYPPVPGDIGEYETLADAEEGMAVALALQASAASPLAPVTTANAFVGAEPTKQLVAEAPQSMGRIAHRIALAPPPRDVVSASLGNLLAQSLTPSHKLAQSHQLAVASLAPHPVSNQSVWGEEEEIEAVPAPAPAPKAQPVVAKADASIVTHAIKAPEPVEAKPAVKTVPKPKIAKRPQPAKTKKVASKPSRKRAEKRVRSASSQRRTNSSRRQVSYAAPRPERPRKNTQQLTSLGLRAQQL
jgi:rare lipoprotein A (peptidoglycan hydrolase)